MVYIATLQFFNIIITKPYDFLSIPTIHCYYNEWCFSASNNFVNSEFLQKFNVTTCIAT